MKTLLLALLVLVLALPSIASANDSAGGITRAPDTESDGASTPLPKSWLLNDIFFVRAHICRSGVTLCGPDPLVSSGANFNAVTRIFAPFSENEVFYFLITDSENAVVAIQGGGVVFVSSGYSNWFASFNLPDGVYKFVALAQGLSSGRISLSEYYRFRVGGPNSSGCCP